MTAGELIEELHKHPAHYRVFVEHPGMDSWNMERATPQPAVAWASVADVRVDEACTIIIDATQGVE